MVYKGLGTDHGRWMDVKLCRNRYLECFGTLFFRLSQVNSQMISPFLLTFQNAKRFHAEVDEDDEPYTCKLPLFQKEGLK